ncbi:MAG: serine/threonine protein kinase [Deltaproteobacteria bacterium]|nr:serine/threonine protein kinase [Deltaproteobacteria bacterium]
MGEVHRARREGAGGFDKTFALKIIRGDPASIEARRDAFLHEARVCARLAHQNIVHAVDFGIDGDVMYLVMEDVEGVNLRDVLETRHPSGETVPPVAALGIAVDVLRGLEHAHGRADDAGRPLGLVHRDLTPNNILLSREGAVKIADFGVAKSALAGARSSPGEIKGKFPYMSPEQIAGTRVDARSDLFSLGVVIHEMWTGRRPFDGANASEVMAAICRCDRDAPSYDGIPDDVANALRRLLAHAPDDRYANAGEALRAFEDLLVARGGVAGREVRELVRRVAPEPTAPRTPGNLSTRTGRVVRRDAPTPPPEPAGTGEPPPTLAVAPRRRSWAYALALVVAVAVAAWLFTGGSRGRTESASPNASSIMSASSPTPETPEESSAIVTTTIATTTLPPVSPTPKSTPTPTPPPAAPVAVAPAPEALAPGFLRVGDLVPYADVVIDGRSVDTTPTGRIPLPPGAHRVLLKNDPAGKRASVEAHVVSGETFTITTWPE